MSNIIEQLTVALAGRYEIAHELGAGGMATVFLGRDVKHDRDVAIKVLHADLGAMLGAERFLAEIKTTARLQHPHILPLLDSGDAGGLLFYVMPVVTGESLRARIAREGILPVNEAIRIATEVAAALDYAHRHGVVHRDIKPDNILLHDGSALVADFGISIAVQTAGEQRITQTGLSLGTPQYMSPEQAMGERNMDGRADIYALGAVTYEMLTGDPPFTGSTIQAILARVMNERPTAITTLRDTVPAGVAQVVHTALAKLPADRFATAAQFAEALNNERANAGKRRSTPALPAPVVAEPRRRGPAIGVAAVGGIVVGALIAGGAWWFMQRSRPATAAGVEPRRYTIVLPDSAPLVAGHDMYGNARRALDLSHDGSQVVYVAAAGSGTHLMLLSLTGKPPQPLSGTDGASGPVFSPDGHAIVYSIGGDVLRRSLDDGATVHLGQLPEISDLAWIGDRIFASGWTECLFVVPASGGDLKPVSSTASCAANGVSPIDDNSEWLLTSDSGNLYGISKRTSEHRALTIAADRDGHGASPLVGGTFPRFVAPGYVTFLRDSVLFAAPFDAKTLQLTGAPQPVIGGMRREAAYGQGHLATSDEGTAVWASGGDGSIGNFVWVDRTGRVVERVAVAPVLVDGFLAAPDGKRITFTGTTTSGRAPLFIADLARHVVDSIALPVNGVPMNWIRAGQGLTLSGTFGDTSRFALLLFDSLHARVDPTARVFEDESPDGATRCAGTRIWPTERPTDATRFDATATWCRFSPNGHYVAWVSAEGLFTAPTDGRGASRVKLAPSGADEPIWSRDGKEILFRSARKWMSVAAPDVAGGGPPAPRVLFEGDYLQAVGASWSLGPDGRLLLLEGPPPMRVSRIEVMTGFPKFLKDRFANK